MEGKIFSFVNSLCFSVFQKGSYGLKVHVTYFGWCWQAGGWQVGQTSNGKVAGSSPRLYNPVWLDMWIAGINVRLNLYYTNTALWVYLYSGLFPWEENYRPRRVRGW